MTITATQVELEELERRARTGPVPVAAALELFDELPPVSVDTMIGSWKGSGLETGHFLDGLLEAFGWYGKRFDDAERAHPLVFADARGQFSVNPALMPLGLGRAFPDALHAPAVGAVGKRVLRVARTRKPAARLRMIEYRGVVTGTMAYDALPILDHFRQADEHTLLGAMDLRGVDQPFMFVLRREMSEVGEKIGA